jgi:hypothetical protein
LYADKPPDDSGRLGQLFHLDNANATFFGQHRMPPTMEAGNYHGFIRNFEP